MNVQFNNAYLEKLFEGRAIAGKPRYGSEVITKFKKTILKLKYADNLKEIKAQRGLNFEALKGDFTMTMTNYKVLNSRGKEIQTDITLHPGEVLQDELEARDIKKSFFAEQLGMKPGHLSELLHGRRHVSAATALKLEKLLGIPAEYWLRVQVYYDLFVERSKEKELA